MYGRAVDGTHVLPAVCLTCTSARNSTASLFSPSTLMQQYTRLNQVRPCDLRGIAVVEQEMLGDVTSPYATSASAASSARPPLWPYVGDAAPKGLFWGAAASGPAGGAAAGGSGYDARVLGPEYTLVSFPAEKVYSTSHNLWYWRRIVLQGGSFYINEHGVVVGGAEPLCSALVAPGFRIPYGRGSTQHSVQNNKRGRLRDKLDHRPGECELIPWCLNVPHAGLDYRIVDALEWFTSWLLLKLFHPTEWAKRAKAHALNASVINGLRSVLAVKVGAYERNDRAEDLHQQRARCYSQRGSVTCAATVMHGRHQRSAPWRCHLQGWW